MSSKKTKRPELRSFADEWEIYRTMVIPKEAGEAQVRVMKEAFYAGAYIAQSMSLAIGGLYTSDEIMEQKMAELYNDVRAEVQSQGTKKRGKK